MRARPGWRSCRRSAWRRTRTERCGQPVGKRLDEIKQEFEREVFLVVYRSRAQRLRRLRAAGMILALHLLRGALIGLPIYLVALALMFSPRVEGRAWYLLILLPGLAGWLWVLARGARADYSRAVDQRLLERPFSYRMLSDGVD